MTSAWQQGADAARAGVPSSRCPHEPTEYHFVTWHNGWAHAMHMIAREQQRATGNERFF